MGQDGVFVAFGAGGIAARTRSSNDYTERIVGQNLLPAALLRTFNAPAPECCWCWRRVANVEREQVNIYVIVTMILAVLYGFHRVLDEVELLKERIISVIQSYVEVRDELDRAKRFDPPELDQNQLQENRENDPDDDEGCDGVRR